MPTLELIAKAREAPPSGTAQPGRFVAELHDRLSNTFYPLAFVLIAVAFAGQAQTTRQTRGNALALAFAAGVGIRLLGIAAANATVVRPAAFIWQYGVPLGACVLSAIAITNNLYPRPQPVWMRAWADLHRRNMQRVRGLFASMLGRPRPGATA